MSDVGRRVRHLKVRVDGQVAAEIEAFAKKRNLSLSDAVRLLAHERLSEHAQAGANLTTLAASGFASLMAAEHTLKLLELIVPSGRQRSLALAEEAADAARDRLEQVERLLAEGETL